MGILKDIQRRIGSAFATSNLVMPMTKAAKVKAKKVSKKVVENASNLWKSSHGSALAIKKLNQAIDLAKQSPDYNRFDLLEIYEQAMEDAHLTSCVSTRKNGTKSELFQVYRNGKPDEALTRALKSSWFIQFMDYALDTILWGFTAIEFDFSAEKIKAEQIDPIWFNPNKNLVLDYPTSPYGGDDIDSFPELLFICPSVKELGLLRKAARYVIYKSYSMSDWSRHSEMFGMPIRMAFTDKDDDSEIAEMARMLSNMGAAGWGIFGDGDRIETLQNSNTDPFKIYAELINLCDAQISKLVNGQTMTADNGSSLAQAQVHERILDTYVESDMIALSFIVNDYLFPFLARNGFNEYTGATFEFDYIHNKHTSAKEKKDPNPQTQSAKSFDFFTDAQTAGAKSGLADDTESEFYKLWQKIARSIWNGNEPNTDDLTDTTARMLLEALSDGYKEDFFDIDYSAADAAYEAFMAENVFIFSAFKSFQQSAEASAFFATTQPHTFSDFLAYVRDLNRNYNVRYLLAEYQHAVASGQMASIWADALAAKDDYDLEYDAVNDARTRPDHRALDGIVRAVDDGFWDTYYPPNGWGCRCTVRLVEKGKTGKPMPATMPAMPAMFSTNTAKQGIVFPSSHPYYTENITPKEKEAAQKAGKERFNNFLETLKNKQ